MVGYLMGRGGGGLGLKFMDGERGKTIKGLQWRSGARLVWWGSALVS